MPVLPSKQSAQSQCPWWIHQQGCRPASRSEIMKCLCGVSGGQSGVKVCAWQLRFNSCEAKAELCYCVGSNTDAMKFGGPAPHIINFRLAMVGFVWGAKQEFQTSRTLVEQAASRPVLVAAVVALTAWASLVPIMKGVKCEAFGKPCVFCWS